MLTSPKKETDDIPCWAITLLKVSFSFPLITGLIGAVAYRGMGTSIMIFPPFMLGAIAGATWGCCVGSIALIASFIGGGWRSLISIPAFLIHFGGAILAILIYAPQK